MPASRQKDAETAVGAKKPKVLLYDLESSPNVVYTWGVREQNALKVITPRQIISFAYKWLGDEKITVMALPDFPGYSAKCPNNRALIAELHKVISESDIAIGHNITEFDDRVSNTDILRHGFAPPPPHRVIDTLGIARTRFRFNSNSLGELGEFLGLGKKVNTGGFALWEGCMKGDPKAWAKMKRYNAGDVALLEKVYYKFRPWMRNHPDMNALDRNDGCPACRSPRLHSRGFSIFTGGKRHRYQCQDCGKWSSAIVKNGRVEFRSRA